MAAFCIAGKPAWQIDSEPYTIASPHDLVVRVVELNPYSAYEAGQMVVRSMLVKIHDFRVMRYVLAAGSRLQGASEYNIIEIREDSRGFKAVWIWLLILHGKGDTSAAVSLADVWYVISVAKYGFDTGCQNAKEWFKGLYNQQMGMRFSYKDCERLLLPTYVFDHAAGFAETTQKLVYTAWPTLRPQTWPGMWSIGAIRIWGLSGIEAAASDTAVEVRIRLISTTGKEKKPSGVPRRDK